MGQDGHDDDGCCPNPSLNQKPQLNSQQLQQHISPLPSSSSSGQVSHTSSSSNNNKRRRNHNHSEKSSRTSSPSHSSSSLSSKVEDERDLRGKNDYDPNPPVFKSLIGGGHGLAGVGGVADLTVMNVDDVVKDDSCSHLQQHSHHHHQPPASKRPKITSSPTDDGKAPAVAPKNSPLPSSSSSSAAASTKMAGNGGVSTDTDAAPGRQKMCWPSEDSPSTLEVSSSTGNNADSPSLPFSGDHNHQSVGASAAAPASSYPAQDPAVEASVGGLEASKSRTDVVGQSSSVTSSAQISIPVHPFMQQQRLSADGYLKQAKGLKRSADKVQDKTRRYMTYLDAVLAFAQCGFEMECEGNRQQEDIYKMYEDTIKMLKFVFSKYKQSEPSDCDKKIFVLNLRIQALWFNFPIL